MKAATNHNELSLLRYFLIVVVLMVPVSFSIAASPDESGTASLVTLDDYLKFAALHNAELEAAFYNWRSAVQQIPQAKSLPDPLVSYGYFIENVETRVGPQQNKMSLMQMFPWFGTIEARTDAASAAANAAAKLYEASKLKLFYEVKDAFYEYRYLASAIDIARENLELLKHFEAVARAKYTTATATHPDIIRAQIELAAIEDVLKSLTELREPTFARLNAILNRKDKSVLPWPEKTTMKSVSIDRDQVVSILISNNPQLAAIDYDIQAAKYRLELAKKQFWPNVGVGVDWIQTGRARSPGVSDSGKDALVLMFSMNLPVWREKYSAAEKQAKANIHKVSSQKVQSENDLIAQAEKILYDFEDASRKNALYGDTLVPKAEQLLEASEVAYQAGTVDFLSLIDAQRTLLDFGLQKERARINTRQRLAKLEMLLGVSLTPEKQKNIK